MANKNWLGMLVMPLVLGMMVVGCENVPTEKTITIKYQITGTLSEAIIEYTSQDGFAFGGSVAEPLPWEKSFSITLKKDEYFRAYVRANGVEQYGTAGGTLTAKIFTNDKEIKSVEKNDVSNVYAAAETLIEY